MPSIDINATVNVTGGTTPPPGGGAPGPGNNHAPTPPGAAHPAPSSPAGAAAKATADLAAARRALTQRLGRTLTDAQVSQVSRDFAEMSRSSQRLRRFGGDMEKWMSGFSATFPSQRQANRHYSDVMGQLGLGSPQQQQSGVGPMIHQAVRGMFRTALPGGGGVAGSIMSQGVEQAGEAGGMASAGGMAMMGKAGLIGALAYAGIKAVQKVSEKVGQAQDESVQYHDLREQVGGAAVGFDELRSVTRKLTDGLGVTSEETTRLAQRYAASSQVYGAGAAASVAGGVRQGAQLSRGFGLAPEAGVEFLATMRHFGQSDSEKDNRKLAYQIGDAVGKTGAFSKADDVMTAIAGFVETTSRQSLQVANIDGFASMLGNLGGMKLPGMDAAGAAQMMQRLSGAWSSGGGAGEASSAMRLGWAQRFGATAFDIPAIDGAGPMASARSTFGKGSPAYLAARSDKERQRLLAMAEAGGDKTFLSLEMSSIEGQYGERALPLALMKQYGLNHAQASVLSRTHADGSLDNLQGSVAAALKGTGKDPNAISLTQMSKLAMISYGSPKDLEASRQQALELSGKQQLTDTEKKELSGAGDTDSLKKALTRIFATRETEDEGASSRLAQVNLDRQFQAFAQNIIPLANAIREGVFALVRKFPGSTPALDAYERRFAREKAEEEIRQGPGTEAKKVLKIKEYNQRDLDVHPADPDSKKRNIALKNSGDLFNRMLSVESQGKQFNENGSTRLGPMTKYGRAVGVSQLLESTAKETAEGAGIPWDKKALYQDRAYNEKLGRLYFDKLSKKYKGDERKTAAAYNWGMGNVDGAVNMAGDQWEQAISNKETRDYLTKSRAGDKSIPATSRPPSSKSSNGRVTGAATLNISVNGQPHQETELALSGHFGQSYAGVYA